MTIWVEVLRIAAETLADVVPERGMECIFGMERWGRSRRCVLSRTRLKPERKARETG